MNCLVESRPPPCGESVRHVCRPRRAAELQFYTSAAAVAMLVPAWIFFMVSVRAPLGTQAAVATSHPGVEGFHLPVPWVAPWRGGFVASFTKAQQGALEEGDRWEPNLVPQEAKP